MELCAWLALPVPAIALGVAVAAHHYVAMHAFAPNVAAMVLGVGGTLLFMRRTAAVQRTMAAWGAMAACLLVALTLLSPGIDGVHRWVRMGPIGLNASTVVSPLFLAATLGWLLRARGLPIVAVAAMLAMHVAQPDAAQCTALGAACMVMVFSTPGLARWVRMVLLAVTLVMVSAAWMRADPLTPVDHVEGIVRLAMSQGLGVAAAAWLALGLLFLPMLRALRQPKVEMRILGLAFGLYLAAQIAMTFAGNFPVPVMGAGAGPVLGWYAMLAALLAEPKAHPVPVAVASVT